MKTFVLFILVFSAVLLGADGAFAISEMEPASVLIFPFFSSSPTKDTILNITNINTDPVYDAHMGGLTGGVILHYYYVDGEDCNLTDRREYLTPGDTLSVMSRIHNPAMNSGWLYVVAENAAHQPCKFDGTDGNDYPTGLIGDAMVADPISNFLWSIPAIGIKAGPEIYKADMDLNGNGFIDFGPEYEDLPKVLYLSSFFEQDWAAMIGELVLVTFVKDGEVDGGANEDVRVDLDFLFYNNDEVEFSQETDMRCWMVRGLKEIFNGADNLGGAPALVPTGWASMEVEDGVDDASGLNISADDLAILGVLVQRVGTSSYSCARLLHHSSDKSALCVSSSLDIE
jgi:hypothetical protein